MRTLTIAVCIGFCLSSYLRAEVVYSNFGDNGEYVHGGYGVGDYDPPLMNAAPFSVPYDTLLDELRVAVAHTQTGSPNVLNVSVYSNGSDGNPALPLETISLVDLPTSGFQVYSAPSTLRPRLEADDLYWIVLSAKGQFVWGLNTLRRYGVTFSTDGGVSWQKRGFTNPRIIDSQTAFSVVGQIVPEPSTAAALYMSGLALLTMRRRKLRNWWTVF